MSKSIGKINPFSVMTTSRATHTHVVRFTFSEKLHVEGGTCVLRIRVRPAEKKEKGGTVNSNHIKIDKK